MSKDTQIYTFEISLLTDFCFPACFGIKDDNTACYLISKVDNFNTHCTVVISHCDQVRGLQKFLH